MPPKSKGRKRRSGVRPASVEQSLGLSTLAVNDVLGVDFTGTVDRPEFLVSAHLAWALRGGTVGEGPIIVGIAHDDYTDAEIEEFIENTAGWTQGDKVAQEIARRLIRTVGKFALQASTATTEQVLNDGKPIKTPLRFGVTAGQGLKFWAYNSGAGALMTGTVIEVNGVVWIRT